MELAAGDLPQAEELRKAMGQTRRLAFRGFTRAAVLENHLNEFYGTGPKVEPDTERVFFERAPTDATLAPLSRALDDLRRPGETDLHLNHPDQLNP